MNTTRAEDGELESSERDAPAPWRITLVHPRAALGRTRELLGAPLELGRESDVLGGEAIASRQISRRHFKLSLGASDSVLLEDLGSHNGTRVNGRRVGRATLRDGDIIGVGGSLLLVHRSPAPGPPVETALVGIGHAHHQLARAIEAIAPRLTTVLVCGETGVGKTAAVAELHRRSRRDGPLITIPCGQLRDDGSPPSTIATQLAAARGGTAALDRVDELPDEAQRTLVALLDSLDDAPACARPRIVATLRAPLSTALRDGLREELAARLARWVLDIPPLRARREDILALAGEFVRRRRGADAPLHARLARKLLRHAWPGNLHELAAAIECAVIEAGDGAPLPYGEGVERLLSTWSWRPAPRATSAPAKPAIRIAASGAWFEVEGRRVDLEQRRVLARTLSLLAERWRRAPGAWVSTRELIERVWPGEELVEGSGQNRIYVALAGLRKLGLREALKRCPDGYALDPRRAIEVVDETAAG
ncbi:MAG: sigma 54-interacting transcriptional regulator [Nannocystaceae bacterium]|nr:sigma 54-interacting transcriptional regulator [Myxococcales bacterium]